MRGEVGETSLGVGDMDSGGDVCCVVYGGS
jgi:hypothetical protein